MSKKIFIFNDGTGQGLDSDSLSNVEKIFRVLPGVDTKNSLKCDSYKLDSGRGYHSLYYRGIGIADKRSSASSSGFWNAILRKIASLIEMVSGDSIKARVEAMLTDIQSIWEDGDKVYFVGFSRGAAAVRIAASLIKQKIPNITIEYLLIFDTVYSVMGPVKILDFPPIEFFDDRSIGEHIKYCDHLIAGDEMRQKFPLTPLNIRTGVKQILFSSSHSDVGGGAEKSCLSDITLGFALEVFQSIGIEIPEANIEALKLLPSCEAPVGWDLLNGTGQTHFPRDFSKIEFEVHSSVAQRCAKGVAPPIALALLAEFKFSNDELVKLKDINCRFKYEAVKISSDIPVASGLSRNSDQSMV